MNEHLVKRLPLSHFERGRMFCVGDLHGCVDLLLRGLDQLRFDPACDTLIIVGDLIDRGPDSARSVQLLKEPFVHAVMGNHEDMLLQAQTYDRIAEHFYNNGGAWWKTAPDSLRQDILDLIDELPIVIEAQTPRGTVGFLHAEVPPGFSWDEFIEEVLAGDDHTIQTALWGRHRITNKSQTGVPGIDRVFVGHTPTRAQRLGNIYPVDSGAVFGLLHGEPEKYPLTIANVVMETQIFTSDVPAQVTEHGGLRLIPDGHDGTRPFGQYATPRPK